MKIKGINNACYLLPRHIRTIYLVVAPDSQAVNWTMGAIEPFTVDMDLCDLLRTMKLGKTKEETVAPTSPDPVLNTQDILMSGDLSSDYPDAGSDVAHSSPLVEQVHGCAYLQALQSQADSFQTTNGTYLEEIFIHREILRSYPPAHQQCARGFSDLAFKLERRAWRADREADMEAVTAFRYEAWSIAASL